MSEHRKEATLAEYHSEAMFSMRNKANSLWMSRSFLTIVGVLYLYLAIWCAVRPDSTSRLVGFELQPGSGQSEFLTVYGGLEFGMALCFLLPLIHPEVTRYSLLCCLLIHGSLVAFRTVGFFLYSQIQPLTWKLAAGEWLIFLLSFFAYVISLQVKKSDS